MKKIVLAIMIAAAAITANAQSLRFGVKGGLNCSKETKNEVVKQYISKDMSFRTGFHVGGVVNYALSSRWELEADFLYSMQGYKDKIDVMTEQSLSNEDYTVTSHYLNLPIAVKFFPVGRFYIECGPQWGYLLSKKDKMEDWDNTNMYPSGTTKKIDFGIFGGLGYRFTDNVFVEARYIHGFTGTSKKNDGGKNRNIQMSLGYLF